MIYADNAATTRLDLDAFEAMKPFLLDSYSNPSQQYSFSRESKMALKIARKKIAKCIGADSEEIYFTSCGTESDNWAIKHGATKNGNIITTAIEHHAILNSCKALETQGGHVLYAPVSEEGIVSIEFISENINTSTQLLSVMFANNEIGSIQPIEELAALAHSNGVLFHTDAVQAVGHVDINVHDLKIDLLSASAHKFNGPKGIGFLYVRKGVNINPFFDGGGQENGKRAGTENVASIVGMSVALEKNCFNMKENQENLLQLEKIIEDELVRHEIDFSRN